MATDPENLTPSTPEATAAVAQSRLGVSTPRTAEPQGERSPLDSAFRIGPGVERVASVRPHEHQSGDPVYRPLRIFTLDPTASLFEGALATVNVPYEPLTPGPCGALVEADNYDGWQQVHYQRVNLDDPKVLLQDGRTPSPSDPLFHQQMVYTVCSTVSAAFQRALGRHLSWGFDNPPEHAHEPTHLRLRPHAFEGRNAYYNRSGGEICIRAIDYCPPVDLQLGEFLRALITADYDLVPSDPWGYREALIDAFWRRELYPQHVPSLFEDALLWRPTRQPLPPVKALTFAELKFAGDPGHPAGARELRRQACALGELVTRPESMAEFGLVPPGHPALQGDTVDLPCVGSIRSTRR